MSFKNYLISASFILACALFLNSCKKGDGFQTTPDGLRYKFFKQDKNGTKVQLGDMVIFQIQQRTPNDSIIYDSYKNEMGAASMIFPEYPHKASFVEGLTMMSKGDSAMFEISVDSFYEKFVHNPLPPYAKSGSYDKFIIRIDSIIPKTYFVDNDKKALDQFMDTIKTQFVTTQSGLRIAVTKKNESGIMAADGDTLAVDYTGKLPNGQEFDSSIPNGAPLKFQLGRPMIKGWTEACRMLHEGEKAIIIVPYDLAYGPQGTRGIPPYSTLIFEMDMKKIIKAK